MKSITYRVEGSPIRIIMLTKGRGSNIELSSKLLKLLSQIHTDTHTRLG